jgi:hypothetical protein
MSRYLNPRSDVVFKKIFGQHKHLMISFLNSLLPLPADGLIESLDYLPTEQIPTIPVLKRTIVDVKCRNQKGRTFIVLLAGRFQEGKTEGINEGVQIGKYTALIKVAKNMLEDGRTIEEIAKITTLSIGQIKELMN